MTSSYYIQHLQLQPHPEGGFYKETYRSPDTVSTPQGPRSASTAIYYLLQQGDFSTFHRIKSDEGWHFYAGDTLHVHMIARDGQYTLARLGHDLQNGECFQLTVPAGAWFAAEPAPSTEFALAGCTVAPGFDFADFEMADRNALLEQFPQHHDIILRLTRPQAQP